MSLYTSAVNAADYGLSTSKTPADNTAALQAALNTGKHVFIPRGSFRIAPGLVMTSHGQRLYGAGRQQSVLILAGTGYFIDAAGKFNLAFEGLRFQGKDSSGQTMGEGSVVINIDGSPTLGDVRNQMTGARLSACTFDGTVNGVHIRDHNNFQAEDVVFADARGWGIFARGASENERVDILSLNRVTYSPNAAARDAGADCTALLIDGAVHTTILNEFRAVGASYGIRVENSPGLPFGQHASYILGRNVEVDYPTYAALAVSHCDRIRIVDLYAHGSKLANNVVFGAGVNDAKIVGGNITSAHMNGVHTEAARTEIAHVEFDWCGQMGVGQASAIYAAPSVRRLSVLGGGSDGDLRVSYHVYRHAGTVCDFGMTAGWRGLSGAVNPV